MLRSRTRSRKVKGCGQREDGVPVGLTERAQVLPVTPEDSVTRHWEEVTPQTVLLFLVINKPEERGREGESEYMYIVYHVQVL